MMFPRVRLSIYFTAIYATFSKNDHKTPEEGKSETKVFESKENSLLLETKLGESNIKLLELKIQLNTY